MEAWEISTIVRIVKFFHGEVLYSSIKVPDIINKQRKKTDFDLWL